MKIHFLRLVGSLKDITPCTLLTHPTSFSNLHKTEACQQ